MKSHKTWTEKLNDDKGLPRVEPIPERASKRWGRGTVALPAPREVDALMKTVPPGKLTTVNEIRAALAKRHRATIGCPILTGISAWLAAHAAEEAAATGQTSITPYWRTLKSGGELNLKYPGGAKRLRQLLEAEGHKVVKRGQRFFVADFERVLVDLAAG